MSSEASSGLADPQLIRTIHPQASQYLLVDMSKIVASFELN